MALGLIRKENRMSTRSLALRVFLGIYIGLLSYHLVSESHELTGIAIGALLLGIVIAVYAHTRTGWVLYALLFVHMAVEWIGHGLHDWDFSWPESALELTHLAFDICFLFVLARAQWKQAYIPIFLVTVAVLAGLSSTATLFLHASHDSHGIEIGILEFLILGGILGCSAFHLIHPPKHHTP